MAEPRLQHVLKVTSFTATTFGRASDTGAIWLLAERIAAVEFLRRQVDGGRARLRRVHRVLDCPWG